MKLLLLIFLLLYSSAHLYVYWRLTLAYTLSVSGRRGAAIMLMLATATPLLVRLAEQRGQVQLATVIAYPAFFWMAVLFLFLTSSACWHLCVALCHLYVLVRRIPRPTFIARHRSQFLACLGIALICSLYGIIEAGAIRTEHVQISSAKFAPNSGPTRIVQLSDVHLGLLMSKQKVETIIAAVKAAQPDILVCTGDFIDGNLTRDSAIVSRFRSIAPPRGAYAVPGNHEYYVGFEQSVQLLRDGGFTVLRGDIVKSGPLFIAGADDLTAHRLHLYRSLPAHSTSAFTLLLKHQPIITKGFPFDLQLSGHIHQGQIFPFTVLTWLRFRVKSGLTALTDGSNLYVSRGTGTWGPPIRFLAPPEITVIDLVPERK